jgi:glycerol-3-phosphate dehydrogenase
MYRARSLPLRTVAFTATTTLALGSAYYALKSDPIRLDSDIPVTKRRPGPLWSPPSREQMLEHLRTSGTFIKRTSTGGPEPGPVIRKEEGEHEDDNDVFDLLIVGAGATGAGVALDAASRGLKVACVERDDFSSGTSSKSTKLVHGGVRYLQKAVFELDYGESFVCTERRRANVVKSNTS